MLLPCMHGHNYDAISYETPTAALSLIKLVTAFKFFGPRRRLTAPGLFSLNDLTTDDSFTAFCFGRNVYFYPGTTYPIQNISTGATAGGIAGGVKGYPALKLKLFSGPWRPATHYRQEGLFIVERLSASNIAVGKPLPQKYSACSEAD